jgi:AcrR family transcriptional regulator
VNTVNIDVRVVDAIMRKRSPLQPRVHPKPVGRYHHGELRRALLDASLAIVAREGTAALSLREVARRVGVSPQASYNHFGDRAELLAAAAEEGLRKLERRLLEARAGARGPGQRLEAIGVAYVTFASTHPAHFRLLSAPELTDKRARAALSAAYEAAFGVLRQAVAECQEAKVVRDGDAQKLAVAAWAMVHGVAWLIVDEQIAIAGTPPDAAKVARDAVRVLFKGLEAR